MFLKHKSIGAPFEITASFPFGLETQPVGGNDRESLPTETLTRGPAAFDRCQKSIKCLP